MRAELSKARENAAKFAGGLADAHAVALARATDAERELSQARTTLARTPPRTPRAFHWSWSHPRDGARALDASRGRGGRAASVARKLADAHTSSFGLADHTRSYGISRRRCAGCGRKPRRRPSVQSEPPRMDHRCKRECTLAQAALEAANAEVASNTAQHATGGVGRRRRALQTPRTSDITLRRTRGAVRAVIHRKERDDHYGRRATGGRRDARRV